MSPRLRSDKRVLASGDCCWQVENPVSYRRVPVRFTDLQGHPKQVTGVFPACHSRIVTGTGFRRQVPPGDWTLEGKAVQCSFIRPALQALPVEHPDRHDHQCGRHQNPQQRCKQRNV